MLMLKLLLRKKRKNIIKNKYGNASGCYNPYDFRF